MIMMILMRVIMKRIKIIKMMIIMEIKKWRKFIFYDNVNRKRNLPFKIIDTILRKLYPTSWLTLI